MESNIVKVHTTLVLSHIAGSHNAGHFVMNRTNHNKYVSPHTIANLFSLFSYLLPLIYKLWNTQHLAVRTGLNHVTVLQILEDNLGMWKIALSCLLHV
jgi:hypothetical protein